LRGAPEEEYRMNAQAALTLDIHGDGVAWLVFDAPDSRVNILSAAVMERLDSLLAELENAARAGTVRAVVVRSGKPGTFIVGADVNEITAVSDAEAAEAGATIGQAVFNRLERLPVPTVAAVDGTCLGGGTELILACGYRLASDSDKTKIGLPEVQLGIIPGFGGTTRLPRLIGLTAALEMILTGKTVSASKAQRTGLIDERVPTPALYERAAAFARERAELGRGSRRGRRSKRGLAQRALEGNPIGRQVLFWQSRKQVMKQTKGHYPAPLEALRVIERSHGRSLDKALALEAAAVGRLLGGDVAPQLLHVYHLMEAAKKASPRDAAPREVERVGVLGAGVMGGGIAQLLSYNDIAVRMKDIRGEGLAQGLAHARGLFDAAVSRRRMNRRDAARRLALVAPTLEYTGFGTLDVVIEAVVERMDIKQQVLREVETKAPQGCVIASNTSSLSITEMQQVLGRPADFCGMHFFNPVHRMPLVEVIRGDATSDAAVATIFALSRRLGKIPIIVRDGPGFLVNRVLSPYLNEAGWLLADGASVEVVDRAMTRFGMPMGPLRLLDEVGLDVARHAGQTMHEAFGARLEPSPPLVALEGSTLLGKKGGSGFYSYDGDKRTGVNPELLEVLGSAVGAEAEIPPDEIRDRLVLVMVNEAARVLEDGIVAGPGDVDLGMITGTGFPPFRGGLLRYADTRGLPEVVARLETLQARYGVRFEPAPLLREHAAAGRGFYS
jgi:3-hydroxyacyl-CoA dehydrogenase / enoyl-CoA hydratase / 3-hydroxybutyryl-CoA epimerase